MTKDEVMKLDERELFGKLLLFVYRDEDELKGFEDEYFYNMAETLLDQRHRLLEACYQAEEKIKEMGLTKKYGDSLSKIIRILRPAISPWEFFDLAHAHPKPRAQAILLTLTEGGG